MKTHKTSNHELFHKCNECTEVFAAENGLKVHLLEKHHQDFKCDECDQGFPTENLLDNHKLEIHKKNYKCDLCDYEGITEDSLELHKTESHVIVACTFCDTFLDTKILLKAQIEKEHATIDIDKVTSVIYWVNC